MNESSGSRGKPKWTGIILVVVAILSLVVIRVILGMAESPHSPPSLSTPDLSSHPVYSNYNFGRDAYVIDFGIQPLWVPTSILTEAMRRDGVLKEALSELGLELRLHSFLKGADVNFYLQRGDLEAAIGGDMPALSAVVHSNALVTSLAQYGFCSIVAGRPMLMEELRGKRVAFAFGSNAHYALLQALSSAGL